ncbi:hypothetical protein [Thauera aromatica]|uniref:hypothetical protein n=1 Tax=Thauera aromatica TaxID=59405 RepID=UPI000D155FFA|nr:hypothetical protein [Thauera aromatica]MCK2095315.1 hypothetical protein [Thauera aromatica]
MTSAAVPCALHKAPRESAEWRSRLDAAHERVRLYDRRGDDIATRLLLTASSFGTNPTATFM